MCSTLNCAFKIRLQKQYWKQIKENFTSSVEKRLKISSQAQPDASPLGLRLVGLLPCAVWAPKSTKLNLTSHARSNSVPYTVPPPSSQSRPRSETCRCVPATTTSTTTASSQQTRLESSQSEPSVIDKSRQPVTGCSMLLVPLTVQNFASSAQIPSICSHPPPAVQQPLIPQQKQPQHIQQLPQIHQPRHQCIHYDYPTKTTNITAPMESHNPKVRHFLINFASFQVINKYILIIYYIANPSARTLK